MSRERRSKIHNNKIKPLRVYDFAKELGVGHNDVLAILEKAGIKGKSHSSSLTYEDAEIVRKKLGVPSCPPKSLNLAIDFKEPDKTELQLIEQAFEETIKNLFSVFFGSYTIAKGDSVGEQKAETNFRNGILHARHIRNRALAIIP